MVGAKPGLVRLLRGMAKPGPSLSINTNEQLVGLQQKPVHADNIKVASFSQMTATWDWSSIETSY